MCPHMWAIEEAEGTWSLRVELTRSCTVISSSCLLCSIIMFLVSYSGCICSEAETLSPAGTDLSIRGSGGVERVYIYIYDTYFKSAI